MDGRLALSISARLQRLDPHDLARAVAGVGTGERGVPREEVERRVASRAPMPPKDPFFDQPYEPPAREAAPNWEAAQKPTRVSANIKPKRKVAALFKSEA